MGYCILTLLTFFPVILGCVLFKSKTFKNIASYFIMFGLLNGIYWILLTSAYTIYGVKKYIEIGNYRVFIQKVVESINSN